MPTSKIVKPKGMEPDAVEERVATELSNLEVRVMPSGGDAQ